MPEISRVDDQFQPSIGSREFFQNRNGSILRSIIDKDMLVLVLRKICENRLHAFVKLADVAFLVVARRDDTDDLHALPGAFTIAHCSRRAAGESCLRE